MAELIPSSPCAGLLPRSIGACSLTETDLGYLSIIAPYAGADISPALQSAHGMAFPKPGRALGRAGARAIWFGRNMALLAGPAPDPGLSTVAAITDQSDAWACAELSGARAGDVLARLVPIDLRAQHFKRGHSARTQLEHLNVSITRTGAHAFLILAFRAMAGTLVHDLTRAMDSIAALD